MSGAKATVDRKGPPPDHKNTSRSILVELALQQCFDFMDGMSCIAAFGQNEQFAARPGGEHHQAHDALAIDPLTVLLDENLTIEAIGGTDEHRGGASMDPQFIGYDQFFGKL